MDNNTNSEMSSLTANITNTTNNTIAAVTNRVVKDAGLVPVKRVLISTANKDGLLPFARNLKGQGCQLFSTTGTKRFLEEGGVECSDVAALTGQDEGFGGRVKTLSFQVMAALLYDRTRDKVEAEARQVKPIDMVVCNFYSMPAVEGGGADQLETFLDGVDIGGPAMLRAAAKNGKWVAAVCDPADYPAVGAELVVRDGCLSMETRMALVAKAFNVVADYDGAIASVIASLRGQLSLRLAYDQVKSLRYGENPHQKACIFAARGADSGAIGGLEVLGGSKELSWNNYHDVFAAIGCVDDLPRNGCAVVKHANPCGMAMGSDQRLVFQAAWHGDPVSAYGSVVAFNSPLTLQAARFLNLDDQVRSNRKFVEVVAAPEFEPGVIEYLSGLSSLRVIRWNLTPAGDGAGSEFESGAGARAGARAGAGVGHTGWTMDELANSQVYLVRGGAMVQTKDVGWWNELQVVTKAAPGDSENLDEELLKFGVTAARQVKSNGIVVVLRRSEDGVCQLLGMGGGQPNRVQSAQLALDGAMRTVNSLGEQEGVSAAWLISDGFIPFPDTVELAAQYGVKKILQPGGSIRDSQVVERCNELGIGMVFAGLRHFRH